MKTAIAGHDLHKTGDPGPQTVPSNKLFHFLFLALVSLSTKAHPNFMLKVITLTIAAIIIIIE